MAQQQPQQQGNLTASSGAAGGGVSEKMQAALLVSKQKFSAFSGAANESLGKFSESVANKSQLIKEDIMEEYERMRLQTLPDKSNEIFGVPIEHTIIGKGQGWTRTIPAIIEETIRYIIENKGYMEEGIFRLSGRISEINALKEEYNRFNGGVNISKFTEDVHSATGLLKLYLRELPESLFVNAMIPKYEEVLAPSYPGNREKDMLALIKLIPQVCRNTLHEIFDLLRVVASYESTNKMGISNLAIIFVSTLAIDYDLFNYVFNNQDLLFYSETVTGTYFPKKNNFKSLTESGKLSKSLPIPKSKSNSCDQLPSPKPLQPSPLVHPQTSPRPMPSTPLTHSAPTPCHSNAPPNSAPPSQPPPSLPPSYPPSQPPSYAPSLPPSSFPPSPSHHQPTQQQPTTHVVMRGQPGASLHQQQGPQVAVRGRPSITSQPTEAEQESNFERMKKKLEESIAASHGTRGALNHNASSDVPTQHHEPPTSTPSHVRGLPHPNLTQQPASPSQPSPQPNPTNPFHAQSQPSPTPPQQPPRGPNAQRPMPQIQTAQAQNKILSGSQPATNTTSQDAPTPSFGSIQNNPFMQQNQSQLGSAPTSPTAKKTTRRGDPTHNQAHQHEGMPF